MKYTAILLFSIIIPLSTVQAENASNWNYYIGLHGNMSQQSTIDPEGDQSKFWQNNMKGEPQKIDNGDTRSGPSFSATAGMDYHMGSSKNIKLLLGGEIFFDHINKTIVQNDKLHYHHIWTYKRPMANKPIYKTNYLTGLRGKAGLRLFECINLYGHAGLTYWRRDLYLKIDDLPAWDAFRPGDKLEANMPISTIWGLGATVNITKHWAINANYMKAIPRTIEGLWNNEQRNPYNYGRGSIEIGIEVATIGIQYYF